MTGWMAEMAMILFSEKAETIPYWAGMETISSSVTQATLSLSNFFHSGPSQS